MTSQLVQELNAFTASTKKQQKQIYMSVCFILFLLLNSSFLLNEHRVINYISNNPTALK